MVGACIAVLFTECTGRLNAQIMEALRKLCLSSHELSMKKKPKLMCYQCLPAAPVEGHWSLNGVLLHSRTDAPVNTIYVVSEKRFKLETPKPR